jgi:hypothetical protein
MIRAASMNVFVVRLYIWAVEHGLCVDPEKYHQAIVIGFPGFRAATVQSVSMESATIPFCRRVTDH